MKQTRQMSETIKLGILLALSGGFMDAYSYIQRDQVFANAQRARFGQSRGKNSFVDARGSILTSRIFVAFHTKL